MSRVLVIPDQHCPFMHKRAIPFLLKQRDKWKTDTVVNIGDVTDSYFASRFQKDPIQSTPWEIEAAIKQIDKLKAEFNTQLVCIGNHDERVAKRCEEAGVPSQFLKDYAAVWDTPFWTWDISFIIDGVLYTHDPGCGGVTGPRRAALEEGRCVVGGHYHKHAGIHYIRQRTKRKQLWGMNVGTVIDEKMYAFAYGKKERLGSVLSCAVVLDGDPILIPMQ